MKKSHLIPWMFLLVLALGSYGIALADGGADPTCPDPPPAPTAGPFIRGDFTAAFYKHINSPQHYNFHAVLKLGNQVHLFSAPQTFWPGRSICDFTPDEIKNLLRLYPCTLGVAEEFGLLGTAVIADLTIAHSDFCQDPLNAMISGEIVIRVVPPGK